MPDTGAPWNLPYPADSDLVRNGAQDIEDLADAVALGLSAAGNAGIGSNTVQTTKLNQFSTTSTSFVDITNYSVTITPTSETSKVLVLAHLTYSNSSGANITYINLVRNSTNILEGTSGTAGRQVTLTAGIQTATSSIMNGAVVFLDSPSTTSATTYKFQMKVSGGTGYLNRRGDSDADCPTSTITVIEVAA
jgi:hypothetical protein